MNVFTFINRISEENMLSFQAAPDRYYDSVTFDECVQTVDDETMQELLKLCFHKLKKEGAIYITMVDVVKMMVSTKMDDLLPNIKKCAYGDGETYINCYNVRRMNEMAKNAGFHHIELITWVGCTAHIQYKKQASSGSENEKASPRD